MKDSEFERRLQELRSEAKQTLLQDVNFSRALEDRIVEQAKISGGSTPSRRLSGHFRRWKGPVATLITISVAISAAGFIMVAALKPGGFQAMIHKQEPATYSAAPKALVADQFGHVTKLRLTVGRYAFGPRDFVTVTLSAKQQKELYRAMQNAKLQHGSPLPSASMMYKLTWIQGASMTEANYREDGAMVMPGDRHVQPPNTVNTFAPNLALSQTVNTIIAPQITKWLKTRDKIASSTPKKALTGFTDNLTTPTKSFQYCIPQLTFVVRSGDINFNVLRDETNKLQDPHYDIARLQKGMDNQSMIYTMKPVNNQAGMSFDVRIDKLGSAWMVTAVGKSLTFQNTFQNPPWILQQPFGKHSVAVIGRVKAPTLPNTQMHQFDETNVTSSNLSNAGIIVYERRGVQGPTHQQLPTKTATGMVKGHADANALAQLKDSTAFQLALKQVKQRHAMLVVVGNSDKLLNTWFMAQVLGVKLQGYDIQGGGSSSEVITFVNGKYQIADGPSASENGHQVAPSPKLLRLVIQNAEFRVDTGQDPGVLTHYSN